MTEFRFLLSVMMTTVTVGARGEGDPVTDAPAPVVVEASAVPADEGPLKVFILPIQGQIGKPTLYILRRGVKEAIATDADIIILDMNTPGGDLASTLEIMRILDRYDGLSVTFVNTEAMSAGAFISAATDEVHFAPGGVIGAAAPVMATGGEIDETMRLKLESYLKAKVRSISEEHPMRADVIAAMLNADHELKVGDEILKPEGELLTLTANEAMKVYGDPPLPLLGAGISDTVADLIKALAGDRTFERRDFEITWSIRLAGWLTVMSPLFLGLGMLCLFIEFKTPGFGIFGVTGLLLMGVVFFGHHLAGLSGNEAFLFFVLGFLLILTEILLFPGLIVPAALGAILMLGSLLWGMTDVWPAQSFEFSWDLLTAPLLNLIMGFGVAVVLVLLLARLVPKTVFWDRMVLATRISGSASGIDVARQPAGGPSTGTIVTAVSDLFPSGQIEFEGQRFDARLVVGMVERGSAVRILRFADFAYIVEEAKQ